MIYTTLNKIREFDPCEEGWEKLLRRLGKTEADDEPLGFDVILGSNGLEDCLWALQSVPEHAAAWRGLACDYAERVLPIFEKERPDDDRPRKAIEMARRHAAGEATARELAAAWDAAEDAARDAFGEAAWNAAWAAAWAAFGEAAGAADGAADRAAGADAGSAERAWQEARLREVLAGSE